MLKTTLKMTSLGIPDTLFGQTYQKNILQIGGKGKIYETEKVDSATVKVCCTFVQLKAIHASVKGNKLLNHSNTKQNSKIK